MTLFMAIHAPTPPREPLAERNRRLRREARRMRIEAEKRSEELREYAGMLRERIDERERKAVG